VKFTVDPRYDDNGFYQHSGIMTQVYKNVHGTWDGYTPVNVTAGNKSGINAKLAYGTTISGKVTAPSGTTSNWYRGVTVSAYSSGWETSDADVKADGTYVIRGLAPGTYTVGTYMYEYTLPGSATSSPAPALVGQYWRNTRNRDDAEPVTVPAAGTTGINFALVKGYTISGTVSLPAGANKNQLAGVRVWVRDATNVVETAYINTATGKWTAYDLTPGSYTVQFYSESTYWDSATSSDKPNEIIGEYYNNATTASAATKVTITTANRTGINATLAVGDSISGKVTLPDASPSEWRQAISVAAITSTGERLNGSVDRTTGVYRIGKLLPGSYTVNFTVHPYYVGDVSHPAPALAPEYYKNSYTQAGATPVTIVAGTTRTGINATLEPALASTGKSISWYDGTNGVKAQFGEWSPTPTSVSYQWLRGGVIIPGATEQIYMLTPTDRGTILTVTATAKADGYGDTSLSTSVNIPFWQFDAAPTPSISGTAKAGSTLTVNRGTWSPTPTFSYRWYRNGAPISGAIKSTYTLTTSDRGKTITVAVTGKLTGYATKSVTSAGKAIPKVFTTTPTPTITGTLRSGSTLTAHRGTWSPAPSYRYQWYRSGVAIPGATSYRYKLTTNDKGKKINVRVYGTKTGYLTAYKTSTTKTIAR